MSDKPDLAASPELEGPSHDPQCEHGHSIYRNPDGTYCPVCYGDDAPRTPPAASPGQWEAPDWCFYCNRWVVTAETHELHCPRRAPRTPPAAPECAACPPWNLDERHTCMTAPRTPPAAPDGE